MTAQIEPMQDKQKYKTHKNILKGKNTFFCNYTYFTFFDYAQVFFSTAIYSTLEKIFVCASFYLLVGFILAASREDTPSILKGTQF